MAHKLNVIFLWHMHQPSYCVDAEPQLLPWSRLHATKDYLGMAEIIARIPGARVNFNFSGILWEQLQRYTNGFYDLELDVCRIPTDSLTSEQKQQFLRKAFSGRERSMILPFKRYNELFVRYGTRSGTMKPDIEIRIDTADLRDLMVWRILSWVYPGIRNSDPVFRQAVEKERFYSEEEKNQVIEASLNWISKIPDLYRNLVDKGLVEVSATPYYHPILPLLIDPTSAREALPKITLPPLFDFNSDAIWHVREAREKHRSIFGSYPHGMWPAEGSISAKTIRLLAEHKVSWIASDEDILAKSAGIHFVRDNSGHINVPELLYRPWRLESDKGKVAILFRDHFLSDLIGFEYQNWDEDLAVSDFEERLKIIHGRTEAFPFSACVAIILDGENAWEHYRGGGWTFLEKLYTRIAANPNLQMRCINDYLKSVEHQLSPLPKIAAGSWINGNFGIWIGHEEENTAWNLVRLASKAIDEHSQKISPEQTEKCRKFIRKAQGSDWFWWYGDDHQSEEKEEFDYLFRNLLQQVYILLELPIPNVLHNSILQQKSRCFKLIHPKTLLSPKIDGRKGSYFEWFGSGKINFRQTFGAMHATESAKVIDTLNFGFDLQKVYLRLNPGEGIESALDKGIRIVIRSVLPVPGTEVAFKLMRSESDKSGRELRYEKSMMQYGGIQAAFEDVFEIGLPFEYLGARRDQRVDIFVELYVADQFLGRIPDLYGIEFRVPTEDYDNLMWEV